MGKERNLGALYTDIKKGLSDKRIMRKYGMTRASLRAYKAWHTMRTEETGKTTAKGNDVSAVYKAIERGLSNEDMEGLFGIGPRSIAAYRAHYTMRLKRKKR